ncbi:MAG: MOSC N-terminal beta barrel domain-containing protein [Cyanobacteria bacterium J06641_5]
MARLTRIVIYPIKSLDGVEVGTARVSAGGALAGDRRWAIVDAEGRFVNAKRFPQIHGLRAHFDLAAMMVSLRRQDQPEEIARVFQLLEQQADLAAWLSEYFGRAVRLQENATSGFPDDTQAYGPTAIATASLEAVLAWFPDLDLDGIRRRFRVNLEIDDVPPFWEDSLCGKTFRIGQVSIEGSNPCQRCPVPTRDPCTGKVYPQFQKTFIARRQQSLPASVDRAWFDHFYRLSLNTRIPTTEAGKELGWGDRVFSQNLS